MHDGSAPEFRYLGFLETVTPAMKEIVRSSLTRKKAEDTDIQKYQYRGDVFCVRPL